ncbi:MAG TPA: cyanophycinase [Sphingobacteriaceae bacterium]
MKIKPVNASPVPKGILVAIGGHENKGEAPEKETQMEIPNPLETLQIFVDLIRKDNAVIEVITTASGEGAESFKDYQKVFAQLKVGQINHLHHETRGEVLKDEDLVKRMQKADGFFFTGGDQLKLTSIYGGTDFLYQLKHRYIREKIVIGGTSAGAMALSTPMIYAGNDEVQQITGEIKITTGLEFLKDVCVDTHFTDRNRFIRMSQVITSNPTCIGMGISEDTCLIIRNGREAEVAGSGIVIIIDGFHITGSNIIYFNEKVPFAVENLKMHLLTRGDRYEIPQNNPPHI